MLCRNYGYYNTNDKGDNYTYNMYLSYSKDNTKLYTRYRYYTGSPIDFNKIWTKPNLKDEYFELILNGSGYPNGTRTMLVETVKVSLGGKAEKIYYSTKEDGETLFEKYITVGGFTVYSKN